MTKARASNHYCSDQLLILKLKVDPDSSGVDHMYVSANIVLL